MGAAAFCINNRTDWGNGYDSGTPKAFCINNCTDWDNGYDSGTRGDCTILRTPPCCGVEPDCQKGEFSANPCIERNPVYIPGHNVSRTCVCEDTYTGEDCSEDLASNIIAEQLAARTDEEAEVTLADLRVGDEVRTVSQDATVATTKPVLFLHEHVEKALALTFHFL
ncbi:hypothetical protein T484DRAFT_1778390 [Baffinella frigidus]|nr:hypothetical protein T484DRAFT_1778390 [Cryptophyta sp. CCMP2293]